MTSRRDHRAAPVRTRFAHLTEDGTGYILGGSLVAGVAAYVYQFMGGRALGAEAFAPVSVLLTIHFLVFIVVLLPVEQLLIRRLTLRRTEYGVPRTALLLVATVTLAAVGYSWLQAEELLRGDQRFVWFVAATILTHAAFAIGRGHLAGQRRFKAYGLASGAASLLRLLIAAAILAVRPTASGFAVGLIVGPIVVLLWRPWRRSDATGRAGLDPSQAAALSDQGLLTGLVLAAAASQALLLGGPLLVAVAGGGEQAVSIAFATFTLMRAPLTFGYNLLARVLPPFTEMAARGERQELRAWGRGLGGAAIVLGLTGAAVGAALGPPAIGWAFGSDFSPTASVAALVAAGVVLAGAGLFVGQVLVARGEPAKLALAWAVGIGAAAVAMLVAGGDPLQVVAVAFVAGETAALAALVTAAVWVNDGVGRRYAFAKRSVDIAISVVVLILAAPLLVVIAAIVKLESPGPVFFRQERVGQHGHHFAIFKIRTMRADQGEAVFVEHLRELSAARAGAEKLRIADDPRITRTGRILRKTSIDELPNLWNVLSGSMTLVGPRPLVPAEASLVGLDHPRFTVKPGVTGLAQVHGRDEISLDERSRLDHTYVDQRSLGTDLAILLRTLLTVVRRPGD